uniref:Uncharacterized protein n=1 Tax=Rhizophora mucronata TaxID=61149 RepID=A0A2P2J9R1_RHIMU
MITRYAFCYLGYLPCILWHSSCSSFIRGWPAASLGLQ